MLSWHRALLYLMVDTAKSVQVCEDRVSLRQPGLGSGVSRVPSIRVLRV